MALHACLLLLCLLWLQPACSKDPIEVAQKALRRTAALDSCGMLLSAVHTEKGEEKLNLIMIDDAIPAGAKLC